MPDHCDKRHPWLRRNGIQFAGDTLDISVEPSGTGWTSPIALGFLRLPQHCGRRPYRRGH